MSLGERMAMARVGLTGTAEDTAVMKREGFRVKIEGEEEEDGWAETPPL